MSNLLTHDMLPFVGIVVGGGIEVVVVHLGRALRDMRSASDVDGSQPQPAIETISVIANLRGA